MSINDKAQIVKSLYLIGCSVEVTGRTTKKKKERDSSHDNGNDGETVEREFKVEETIEDRAQYARATKLAGTLRTLADRFGASTKYGYLTDEKGKIAFEAALARLIANEVADHNRGVDPDGSVRAQTAIVTPDPVVVPIGVAFGEKDVAAILDQIARELTAQRAALESGDTEKVTNWLKRGQRLSTLVPGLNQSVVTGAIEALREAKNTIAARIRTHFADADAYRATLGEPLANTEILKDALQCVEWDRACEQVEAALGWLQPASEPTSANEDAA